VRIVYNPVVRDDIPEQAAMPVDHAWFDDPDAVVILSAGRLVPAKDFGTLIRAIAAVRKSVDARLVILGSGEERDRPGGERDRLMALARRLRVADAVDIRDFVSNPFRYMSRASVFVVSSIYEGLSMVLVEAMACGTPVVSTNCPHGPAEVLEDGRWGPLVPVGDPAALADAILGTLRNPVAPALLIARSRAFSVARSVDHHLRLIEGDAAGGRVARTD